MTVAKKKSARWSDVKVGLDGCDRQGLIGLVRDLYEASGTNRRFLHARFVPSASALEDYRRLVKEAVFPDPFSRQPIRLRDATRTITEYRRSTGDIGGSVDLMLEFVEAGTEQAVDLGYGDDAYFAALERKVNEVVRSLTVLPESERTAATARLVRLGKHHESIGWGYGDFLGDVAAELQAREAVQVVRRVATRSTTRRSAAGRRTSRSGGRPSRSRSTSSSTRG